MPQGRFQKRRDKHGEFLNEIERLMLVEGFDPAGRDRSEAAAMDEELSYVVCFCKENGITLSAENVKGILICLWSKVADGDFTCPAEVDQLIDAVLKAL